MQRNRNRKTFARQAGCGLLVALFTIAHSAAAPPKAAKKLATAPRPQWTEAQKSLFFDDVLAVIGKPPEPAVALGNDAAPPASVPAPAADSGSNGVAQTAAEVLEDELKNQVTVLADATRNPSTFKSGGFKLARQAFSLSAVLLGAIEQHAGPVRWKESAGALGEGVARAGFNCKVASDASYKEARSRLDDLRGLLRGDTADVAGGTTDRAGWPQLADRQPLMARLEEAQRTHLEPWTASESEFTRNVDALRHEAAIARLIAQVIADGAYEFADEETYHQSSESLADEMRKLIEAAEAKDFAKAQAAVRQSNRACDQCHRDFRS